MMSQILESGTVWRLGWVLLHSLWQIALVGMLAALLLRGLKRQSPQLRYAVACGAMAAMILPLIGTFFLLETGARPNPFWPNHFAARVGLTVGAPLVGELATDEQTFGSTSASQIGQTDSIRVLSETPWMSAAVPWIAAGWLTGCTALSMWNLGAWIAAQRLRRLTTVPTATPIRQRLSEIASQLHIARPVELLDSLLVKTPIMIGYFRPVILLPAALHTHLTAAELDALLAHELAHIRRHDYLVNLVQTVAETLLFFHPAVWWISGRIRVEREYCCDDVAASFSGRIEYARALARVAQGCPAPQLSLAITGPQGSAIVNRVRRVLGAPATDGSTWLGGVLFTLVAIVPLILGLSFAAAQDGPGTADPPRSDKRQFARPIGFTDEQDVALVPGPQKTFAGIEAELQRKRGTPALRFPDLYAVRVDKKTWTDKTAQQMWKEYQEGAFAILPGERGTWIPLGGKLPIVIYLGGVGLVEVRELSDRDPLTVQLRFKLLKFPPGHLGHPLKSDEDKSRASRTTNSADERVRAARLAAEERKAAGSREIFRPTTRGSGKTSWSKAFPARLAGGVQGHMMLVHAHRGDRWPVTVRGDNVPLFHAELLDGDDDAVTVRITRARETIERTIKRDQHQELEIAGKRCRLAYASTTVAKTQEPHFVDHATIIVEIRGEASGDM